MSGLDLITQTFENKNGKIAAYMPYFPVGFPDYNTSIDILEGLAKSGADLIEVGVPFSDPLADGPTVQYATQIALKNGTSLPDCVRALRELRSRGVTIPLMLMSYVNPLIAYGAEKLVADATESGASGFIIPDLPPDEAMQFQGLIENGGAGFSHMLAPTSDTKRIELVSQKARGFIYLVSVAGVTGARDDVPPHLKDFIGRVRRVAKQPLAVGFGIGSPEKARAIGELADGVIIGSKLIKLADENPDGVIQFSESVVQALQT